MTQKVQNIIFHENYSSPGVYNDIALVQLAEEISFTKYVRRICLPEAKMKLSENASVVVTGWGTLYMNGKFFCKKVIASWESSFKQSINQSLSHAINQSVNISKRKPRRGTKLSSIYKI